MFKLVHRHDLSRKHYEEHPAWADYSEPDDIEEIVSWGIPRDEISNCLQQCTRTDAEYFFQVLRTDPLPSFRFLHLRASIIAADGTGFSGYVVGEHPYCVALFFGEHEFGFNVSLPDFAELELARLRRIAGLPLSPFFPLRYCTQFHDDNGHTIEGVFDYDRNG